MSQMGTLCFIGCIAPYQCTTFHMGALCLICILFYMGMLCFIWVHYILMDTYVPHGVLYSMWVHHVPFVCIMVHMGNYISCGCITFHGCIMFHMVRLWFIWVHYVLMGSLCYTDKLCSVSACYTVTLCSISA